MEASAYLTMTNVAPEEWAARVDEAVRVIGRSRRASIRIPHYFRRVSRRHAEIWADAQGSILLREAGSKAGTKINGVWIEPTRAVRLVVGDRVWLGQVELMVTAAVSPLAQVVADVPLEFEYDDDDESLLRRLNPHPDRLRLQRLTPAELDVVLWMCRGYLNDEELGQMLHRSPNTVRTQVGSIFRKLEISSRAELVSWLRRGSAADSAESRAGLAE